MQTLQLNEENKIESKGFWRRQFQTEATTGQLKFDWFFGVIMPVVCFVFDPIVFKNTTLGTAYLGTYKPFAYLLSFVSVMAMAAWLIWGRKLKWLNAFLAGLFIVGGIISLGIGIVLSPISLLGLIFLIGILGFTPLFSAAVFLRNARRAYQAAQPFLERKTLVYSFALSAIFSAVIPAVINAEIKHSLNKILKGDVATIQAQSQKLKYVAPLVNADVLTGFYPRSAATRSAENEAVAAAYKEITGEDLEASRQFMD